MVYSVLRRCIPRTLVRIWIGELLLLLGVMTLFVVDSVGHAKYYSSSSMCIWFALGCEYFTSFSSGNGSGKVITTSFEFISVQSPHSMKGLLIGVSYAIRGTFKFLGTISILPFSLRVLWPSDYMKAHWPPVTNCGFNSTIGFICLILFTVTAKRYKNRERNDPRFNQIIVERVWADGLQN